MDPEAALKEIREVIADTQGSVFSQCYIDGDIEYIRGKCDRLAELVNGLDEWLSDGGFLPEDWRNEDRR